MKTKTILMVTMIAASVLLMTSCTNNFIPVRIDVENAKALDFEKYDSVIYADLVIESPPKDYSPEEELKTFFLKDLPTIIKKDEIRRFAPAGKTGKELLEAVKNFSKDTPNALLISGKVTFDIKSRSKIQEVKNDAGKKEKKFVQIQHWALTIDLEITEMQTGKSIFKKSYPEKLSDADISNPKYNFEELFFKINNRFAKQISADKQVQRRYLYTR